VTPRAPAPTRRTAGRRLWLGLLALACRGAGGAGLERADAAWAGRAQGQRDGLARPGPIDGAVRAYESALAARPESLEARWKLLRALHFAGDFSARSEPERRALFERAVEVAEEGLDGLARRAGAASRLDELDSEGLSPLLAAAGLPAREVARLHFWAAINWGAWSRSVGLLSAVRQGVANRLERYARVTIALEPAYDDGGAFRLLGRLHAELPRVPFVSGWVDRSQALPLVERAYAMAPANPGNRLLLALTLLDLAPERRGEALALLRQVEGLEPRPGMRVEDLSMREEARARLAESGGEA
jgi:tetratricopeptide (TPR) repeat protein